MNNFYILTEERPRASVVRQIIELYKNDFNGIIYSESEVRIRPDIKNGIFQFRYIVEGINLVDIDEIIIKTVSGSSSFFDYLVVVQKEEPSESMHNNVLMAIEETKTSDDESRNTGVYQRSSKFVFIDAYYKNVKLYMLYNDELDARELKKPSDTSIFGTNMLLTIGASIVGKDTSKWFNAFSNLDELIAFKSSMRKPPAGNVPIDISKFDDRIEISGRLSKPSNAGNIGHDPNIGALSIISKCIRHLGWNKKIVITRHGVSQQYIDRIKGKNKFLYICSLLNIELEGINMPNTAPLPGTYWHYEMSSEKMASILLHITGEYFGLRGIYQNHAGCERGYFKTKNNNLITLPKKDKNGVNLYLPDLILHDPYSEIIILIEGKKLSTLNNGLEEIKYYDSIENEFISKFYPNCPVYRFVSIFGGDLSGVPNDKVIIYLANDGRIIISPLAPECIKSIFRNVGVNTW